MNPYRALIGAATLMATLAVASPALATEHHPKGDYAPFADCPLSNPAVQQCLVAETNSGEFSVGKKRVPINKTITLQGGIHEEKSGALQFFGAEDGNTLAKVALTVPGGLFGIKAPESWPTGLQEIFNNFINEGFTGVTETTELAQPATNIGINTENLITEEGVALSLPVKVKLDNVLLGSACYVGSESNPIHLNLTTGTTNPLKGPNKPIKGSAGTPEFKDEFNILTLSGGSLVDNTFTAPGATGCGGVLSFLIDPLVDSILGVPAEEGSNTAILTGKLSQANAAAVKASE